MQRTTCPAAEGRRRRLMRPSSNAHTAGRDRSRTLHWFVDTFVGLLLIVDLRLVAPPVVERDTYVWILDHSTTWWLCAAVLYYACNRMPHSGHTTAAPTNAFDSDQFADVTLRGCVPLAPMAVVAMFTATTALVVLAALALQ